MRKFKIHILGLVHLPWSREYVSCAFTQKNLKLAKMLTSLGHEVYGYGARPSKEEHQPEKYIDSPNFHFVETHTLEDIRKDYGEGDNRFETGYNWHEKQFKHDFTYTVKNPSTLKFYGVASEYINKIKKPDDFLLRTMGRYHDVVAENTGLVLDCESGIGYTGSEESTGGHKRFRAFESSSMMHYSYGAEMGKSPNGINGAGNGNYFDRVIPNYFDGSDFTAKDIKKDYLLFIGRMISRKGVLTAVRTAEAVGKKLILAGQGARVDNNGNLIGEGFVVPKGNWEYVGVAGVEKRRELYANALITMVPTEYLEPFGGTNVESRLSGTPVLCTNFGAFPEQITNGLDGYCCDTLDDFIFRAKQLLEWKEDDYYEVKLRAQRYLMDNVKWDYQKWFEDLMTLYETREGWGLIRKEDSEYRSKIQW